PRYQELAAQIVAKLPEEQQGDPLAQAAAIIRELETTGIYDESANYADDQTEDPIARFLFEEEERRGHALHFAHAAAYLLRSRGVPARLVEGYVSSEANRRGGTALMLRELDAHIWPEIHVQGVGWVPIDVAPERTVSPGITAPDPELQRMLGEMLRGQYKAEDAGQEVKPRRSATRTLAIISQWVLRIALALLLLVGALILPTTVLIKLWRRWRAAQCDDKAAARLVFRATLDRLAEAGLVRAFGETREAFAARVRAQVPSLEEHTRAHHAAFYGSRQEHRSSEQHRALAKAVQSELAAAVHWRRRWMGFFNPLTLWQAR
ncbi:MAG: transglutaminase-like domain-containing protein, partial [Myxococcota bacterium]